MTTDNNKKGNVWARPGMTVTFRAEVMPGVEPEKRTFRVKEVLWNDRVTLHGLVGEHAAAAFMPLRFGKKSSDETR